MPCVMGYSSRIEFTPLSTKGPAMSNTLPATATIGDFLEVYRQADHLAHCPGCRTLREASDQAAAENGASIERRDRRTLGLRTARPRL